MTNQTTAQTDPATAASQPELPPSVTELTTLLQMVNKLFPLPERPAKLSTREGRAYKQAVAQRDAYIKALQAAIDHATAGNRLRQEFDLVIEQQGADAASYKEQIRTMGRYLDLVGPCMTLAFQLGLVTQRRPQDVSMDTVPGTGLMVVFNLGDLRIKVMATQQRLLLSAPGMQQRSFDLDDEGNLLTESFERLAGYLTMAGYPVKPEDLKKALSKAATGALRSDPNAKINALVRALGRTAMEGAGVSFTKGGTRGNPAGTAHSMGMFHKSGLGWDFEPSLSMHEVDEVPLDLYLFDMDPVSLTRGKPRAMDNLSARLREWLAAHDSEQSDTSYIFIITDGLDDPTQH